ncbi:MAG: hypothetical protein ACRDP1_13185 [Nocardioidaceae bacterium]
MAGAIAGATFGHFRSRAPGTVVSASFWLHYPRGAVEAGHKAYWFLSINGARFARYRTTTTIPRSFKPGYSRLSANLRSGVPPGQQYHYFVVVLVHDLPGQGLGIARCSEPWDRYALGLRSCLVPRRVDTSVF